MQRSWTAEDGLSHGFVNASAPTLRFEHLGLEEGLAQGSVHMITQDRQGFIWVSTGAGLLRYDGYGFEVYAATPFDTTSLSHSQVQGIAEAAGGDLWVGTLWGGLNRMDRATGAFTHYRQDPDDPTSLPSDHVNGVFEDSRGDVWVGDRFVGGLSRMRAGDDGRFTHYRHDPDDPASLSHDDLREVIEDADRQLWVGSANGLNRIDPETETITRFLYDLADAPGLRGVSDVHGLCLDPEVLGVLWLATGGGLVRFDRETGAYERFLIAPNEGQPNPVNHLRDVVPDPSEAGVLWVATGLGLARFDARTEHFTPYRHDPGDPHSLRSDDVQALFVDHSGMLWVGTRLGGLSVADPKPSGFVHLQHDPEDPTSLAPGSVVGVLYEDRAGVLWAGSRPSQGGGFITRLDPATGRGRRYRHDPGDHASILAGQPSGIAEDTGGSVWVGFNGAEGGLVRFDGATGDVTRFRRPRTPERGESNAVTALLSTTADPDVLWVGRPDGLAQFDTRTGQFTAVPLELDGTIDMAQILHEGAEGTLWIGTYTDGLVRRDASGTARRFAHDARDTTTLSGNLVNDIHERAREPGVLWLAIYGGGLNRFDTRTGTATHYTVADGLPDNHVYGILEDETGTLWMSTKRGISSFDPETETFQNYGLDDGLMALVSGWKASARGVGGVLYFGNPEGITLFSPEHLSTNTVPLQVALTGLRISNAPVVPGPDSPLKEPLSETEQITLAHDQNEVAFNYVGLHFQNPAKNRYAYRLDGFDEVWVEAGSQRSATYTNLPPGRYTFRVKAANSDGVWNEEGASVGLTITPPWWHTWWAYGLYGLLFAAGVLAVDRVQRRRLLAKERARARVREAQLQAEAAETRAVALRELDEAKGRFFANISHEFRTPLTLILAATDGLDGEAAASVRRSAQRLLRLVGQLLDLARLDAGKVELRPRPGRAGAFAANVARAFAPLAEREGVELTVRAPASAPVVLFDTDAVEKVVSNLVSNAVKFTGEGGKVVVAVTVEATNGGASVEVTVRDTGPGIAPGAMDTLFDRFAQARDEEGRQGTGLGLALVHDLVGLMGGTLDVESEPGFGSTFTVRLLLALAEDEAAVDYTMPSFASGDGLASDGLAVEPEDTELHERTNIPWILVVDDNEEVRALVCRTLLACRTTQAVDGEGALARAREAADAGRPFDLILADVMMPRLDGFGLCRAVRADVGLRHTPVVLLTARATAEDAVEGLLAGADDYIAKPFHADELRARVARLVRRPGLRAGTSTVALPLQVAVPSADEAFAREVLRVAGEHLDDPDFTAESLAVEVGLSSRQLARRLKGTLGQTPGALLRELRLRQAALLLERDAGTVAEVAYQCGFRARPHFSRAFKARFGRSPSARGGPGEGDEARGDGVGRV